MSHFLFTLANMIGRGIVGVLLIAVFALVFGYIWVKLDIESWYN